MPLAGCSRSVPVDPVEPAPPAAVLADCARFMPALPATVAGGQRRDVRPDDGMTAAWGDPAVALRCGVPLPAAYRPDAVLTVVDGVGWLPEEVPDGHRFTTVVVGDPTHVEVTVPTGVAPQDVLVDLAPAVSTVTPPTSTG